MGIYPAFKNVFRLIRSYVFLWPLRVGRFWWMDVQLV